MSAGRIRRFGFITTNSITQSFNRRIVANALAAAVPCRVAFAVPDHPWVATEDGAAVRIAMTVGARGQIDGSLNVVIEEKELDDIIHASLSTRRGPINTDLSVGLDITSVFQLASNRLLASMGPCWVVAGFLCRIRNAILSSKKTGLTQRHESYRSATERICSVNPEASTRSIYRTSIRQTSCVAGSRPFFSISTLQYFQSGSTTRMRSCKGFGGSFAGATPTAERCWLDYHGSL